MKKTKAATELHLCTILQSSSSELEKIILFGSQTLFVNSMLTFAPALVTIAGADVNIIESQRLSS